MIIQAGWIKVANISPFLLLSPIHKGRDLPFEQTLIKGGSRTN